MRQNSTSEGSGDPAPLKLFDDTIRTETRRKMAAEPLWSYLNQSARASMTAARKLLEEWFAHYPEPRLDLHSRFRSADNAIHRSAFLELYIHELLRRAGYTLQCHPDTGGAKHPDYKVFREGKPEFYLEVVLPRAREDDDPGGLARWNALRDAINGIDVPNGFLWLRRRDYPKRQPELNKICRTIRDWVESLESGGIERNISNRPYLTLEVGGVQLDIEYRPRAEGASPIPGKRAIGIESGRAFDVDEKGTMQAAFDAKAKRYGPLDLPYVIAVGVPDDFVDLESVFIALLGYCKVPESEGVVIDMGKRTLDGILYDNRGPRKKNVSAVLVIFQPSPWTIGTNAPVLIHHPWAERPLTVEWPLTELVPDHDAGLYRRRDGQGISEYLDLPTPWPVPDPPRVP
jgi:hypothetical protein